MLMPALPRPAVPGRAEPCRACRACLERAACRAARLEQRVTFRHGLPLWERPFCAPDDSLGALTSTAALARILVLAAPISRPVQDGRHPVLCGRGVVGLLKRRRPLPELPACQMQPLGRGASAGATGVLNTLFMLRSTRRVILWQKKARARRAGGFTGAAALFATGPDELKLRPCPFFVPPKHPARRRRRRTEQEFRLPPRAAGLCGP